MIHLIKVVKYFHLQETFLLRKNRFTSFDALMTQVDILDTINNANNKYIAKVKSNQKALKDKVELTISNFYKPTQTYEDNELFLTEGNKIVKRKIDIYQNRGRDIVLYDSKFKNIHVA